MFEDTITRKVINECLGTAAREDYVQGSSWSYINIHYIYIYAGWSNDHRGVTAPRTRVTSARSRLAPSSECEFSMLAQFLQDYRAVGSLRPAPLGTVQMIGL